MGPLSVTFTPVMFDSPLNETGEPSENSETTQSQDPDKCRQIFATETQFDLVCPEDGDESIDTVVLEASDYTENTQTFSQYVAGSDTQDITQEMYPATLSQCSEPLPRSARRPVQVYEFDSEPASDPLDSSYVPPGCEFPPPLRREDAITPSTSSKHDLDSTEVESDENEPPKKKKKKK